MSPQTYERLRKEIREHGYSKDKRLKVRPCTCKKNPKSHFEIIDGEHRFHAGSDEGMTTFPCTKFNIPEFAEASFQTFILNNLRGEINEIKLAVLVGNWRKKNIPPSAIYSRTGLRASKQKALLDHLRPTNISPEAMSPVRQGQHTSMAFVLSLDEAEIVHRAIKLTRLKKDVDAVLEIAEYYNMKHELTFDHQETIKKLFKEAGEVSEAEGLVKLCEFYLANVEKHEIRRD